MNNAKNQRTVLSEKVIAYVRASVNIRTKIAAALNVNPFTVGKWAKNNDPQLCLPDSLAIIKANITLPNGESYTTKVTIGETHLQDN